MADDRDVRIPLEGDNRDRRRINIAAIGALLTGIAIIAAVYYMVPRAVEKRQARRTVVIVGDTIGPNGTATMRAQKIVVTDTEAQDGRDFAAVVKDTDASLYEGKWIRVTDALVQTVPGDKLFTIGDTATDSLLVRMDEPTAPGAKGEWDLIVRPEQIVRIGGEIRPMPSREETKKWGLTDEEWANVGNTKLYMKASRVDVVTESY
jgi:hypothetical protein